MAVRVFGTSDSELTAKALNSFSKTKFLTDTNQNLYGSESLIEVVFSLEAQRFFSIGYFRFVEMRCAP